MTKASINMSMTARKKIRWIGLLALSGVIGIHAQTRPSATEPHCTLQFQDHYICDGPAFLKRVARAHTVRIDADRLDLFGAHQVQDLVEGAGKQATPPSVRPDLIFDLRPVDRSGRIDFGPGDIALATLSVYDPAKGAGPKSLIWVETLDGQENKPWPSVVTDLIRRFKEHALPSGS